MLRKTHRVSLDLATVLIRYELVSVSVSESVSVYLTVDQGCLARLAAVSEQTASGVGRGRDL